MELIHDRSFCQWKIKILSSLALFAFPLMAHAISLSVPATSSTGNYIVSWSNGGQSVELFEQVGSGSFQSKGTFAASGSYSVTNKPLGTYGYYAKGCTYNYGGQVCTNSSIYHITVQAAAPTLAPVASISYPATDKDGDFMVTWPSVTGATYYVLQQKTGAGAWQQIQSSSVTFYSPLVDPGSYAFQVKSCNSEICATSWTTGSTMTVTGRVIPTTSHIVYIHTDAQGSPAAETNEQGNENE